ncbi:MAG: chromosomal replication initiator protein DnaA, partial [Gammaproteobacteria bacterium]|nr:chromosomal replication initiator protein DnaA [Gammaproteobacteria bacterium]
MSATWSRCVGALEGELPEQQFNTWVRPLQAVEGQGGLRLLAPNRFVVDWVKSNLLKRIENLLLADGGMPVTVEIGSRELAPAAAGAAQAASG